MDDVVGAAGTERSVGAASNVVARAVNISVRYPSAAEPAVRSASFEVPRSSLSVLIGPNGGGKSAVLSALAGILRPEEGAITWSSRQIGYASQQVAVYVDRTVIDNLIMVARTVGISPQRKRRVLAEALLEEFLLEHLATSRARELSGGEARRLHVACALVGDPDLILLDEPTTGCDIDSVKLVMSAVEQRREQGAGVVTASHDYDSVSDSRGRVLMMSAGNLSPPRSVQSFIERYAAPFVELEIVEQPTGKPWAGDERDAFPSNGARTCRVATPKPFEEMSAIVRRYEDDGYLVKAARAFPADFRTAYLNAREVAKCGSD